MKVSGKRCESSWPWRRYRRDGSRSSDLNVCAVESLTCGFHFTVANMSVARAALDDRIQTQNMLNSEYLKNMHDKIFGIAATHDMVVSIT